MFTLIVVLPTIFVSVYYSFFASRQFVSEAQYIVRGISSRHAGGLDSLFSTFGISRTADDSYAIQDFLRSRSAVAELNKSISLRELFSRPEADGLARFPHFWRGGSDEMLHEYFRKAVSIQQDSRGISTLRVTAFRASDAHDLAAALIKVAERMVNTMNERAQNDTLMHLRDDVQRAEKDVVAAQADLATFRNSRLLVDPTDYSVKILETIGELSGSLAETRSQIAAMEKVTPDSPQLESLRARESSLAAGIRDQRAKLGGDDTSVASQVSVYDRLSLLRDLADKRLTSNLSSLEIGRQEARRQQIYIEEIATPNLPDQAIEPQRSRMALTGAVLSFAIFCIVWMFLAASKEHAQ